MYRYLLELLEQNGVRCRKLVAPSLEPSVLNFEPNSPDNDYRHYPDFFDSSLKFKKIKSRNSSHH
jgi:hypothetical protein